MADRKSKRPAEDEPEHARGVARQKHGHHYTSPMTSGASYMQNGDQYNNFTFVAKHAAECGNETIQQNNPPDKPRNGDFCGRDQILHDMHSHLKPPRERGDTSHQRSCVLCGLGGMGKTQIAIQYTWEYYQKGYDNIFWVASEKPAELAENYSALSTLVYTAQSIGGSADQQKKIRMFKNWLSNPANASWLLIFDNVSELNAIKDYIPTDFTGSIIITTQTRRVFLPKSKVIHVEGLSDDEGASLLNSILHPDAADDAAAQEISRDADAREISRRVGGLPLAIAQIGGYIRHSQRSVQEFMKIFNKKRWYDKAGPAALFYDKTLQTVFDITLGELKPDARNLLDCIAFFSPENIWEDIFFRKNLHDSLKFLQDDDADDEDDNEEEDAELNAKVFDLLAELVSRCLITRIGDSTRFDSPKRSLSIHRSLRDDLIIRLKKENNLAHYQKVFSQAFQLMRDVTPRQSPRTSPTFQFAEYERLLPHVLSLCSVFEEAPKSIKKIVTTLEFAELLSDVANYMWERNLLKDAFRTLETAEKICNQVLSSEDPNPIRTQIIYLRASFELDHGCIMREQGLRHKEQILRLREKRLELFSIPETRETDELQLSTAENNLACAYIQCEDYEKAEPLLQHALMVKRRWGDESSDKTASGIAEEKKNLALVALSRGQADLAMDLSNEAVRIFKNWAQDKKIAGTLFHRFMRASVMFNAGDLEGALRESIDVLEAKKNILDEESNEIFDSYYAVGLIYHLKGDLGEAERHLRNCLEHRNQNYDTSVARAIHRLSLVLEDKGERDASPLRQEAYELRDKILLQGNLGVDLDERDSTVVFDQMVTCWAGRYSGKQNIAWQRQKKSGERRPKT